MSQELGDAELRVLDQLLATLTTRIDRTRKGHVWDIWVRERPIHVAVEIVSEVLWDAEEDLIALGTLPEQTPQRVVLSAGANEEIDWEVLTELASAIENAFDGRSTAPVK